MNPVAAAMARDLRDLPSPTTPDVRAVRRRYSKRLAGEPPTGMLTLVKILLREQSWATRVVADELLADHPPPIADPGDTRRTLAVCRALVDDRDDMVVKALSWALRELSKRDPQAVADFVRREEAHLAARVRREVHAKLETGRKTGMRKRPASTQLSVGAGG